MNSKEIEIPVPWGTISAKSWGSCSNPIVLMLHGLEDNANSFDELVFKLPSEYYYVSIDLPGHGKSDNLPSSTLPLQGMDYVYVVKMIVDHFDRDKYIIIGHSFGAILGMQFGLVYPEKMDKMFILDTIWFQIVEASNFGYWARNKFEELSKTIQKTKRYPNPEFTYKECYDMMAAWRYKNSELTANATKTLLERSIAPCRSGKYKFTRDSKLKSYMCYPVDERYACEVLKSHNINFKVVVIVTEDYDLSYNTSYPALVKTYKEIGDWIVVKGNHHVHLNNPNLVADVINTYLDECIPI